MLSLEQALLSLRAKDTITILGENYKVENIVSATDGKILKAQLRLVKPEASDFCVSIEISTRVFDTVNLDITKI